ncbi:hypothetical protein [Paeniglutamicibacter antarcticus]|uniref:Amino acid permease/ SLC12A domain-containing protein n=1 Tax=Paeniglutamicibacter antarcticus TaxID=494023 RepID=A0ABP9TMA4_9MICC
MFLVVLTGLNALSAKAVGESWFWLSLFKVPAVVLFLIAGVLMILGILVEHLPGFSNRQNREDLLHGGFSFHGTELVCVTAGEAKNPKREIPRAIRTFFWRSMIFCIGSIVVIGCLVPFTDRSSLGFGPRPTSPLARSHWFLSVQASHSPRH